MKYTRPAVLVDLDGTLCNHQHRLPLIAGKTQDTADWDTFSLACSDDVPFTGVIRLVKILEQSGHIIIIASGRSEVAKENTVEWLHRHEVPFHQLHLRPLKDYRSNADFKESVINYCLTRHSLRFVLAIDDYEKAADRFESLGIPTILVAECPLPKDDEGVFQRIGDL